MSSAVGRLDKIIRELRLRAQLTTEDIIKIQETSKTTTEIINMAYAVANSNFYEHPELLLPETPKDVVFWANELDEYKSQEWQYWNLVRESGYYKPLIISLKDKIDYFELKKLTKEEIITIVKKEREKLFPKAPPPQQYVIEAKPGYY